MYREIVVLRWLHVGENVQEKLAAEPLIWHRRHIAIKFSGYLAMNLTSPHRRHCISHLGSDEPLTENRRMPSSRLFALIAAMMPMAICNVSSAQTVSTDRPLVEIGPVGDECRVSTCIEATAERAGICAVQILDGSGSMDTNARFDAASSGIGQFIDSLDADRGDMVGMLVYSGPIRLLGGTPLANPDPAAIEIVAEVGQSYDAIRNALPGLSTNLYSALTPLAAGIDAAKGMLADCPAATLKLMIVSTDGLPNWHDGVQCTVTPTAATACTDAAMTAAAEAKSEGAHIVTIGIDLNPSDPSDAFGISLLRDIATSPNDANFFNTGDGLGQSDIFAHIARTVASPRDVTFFEPLPDSCWRYVPGSTSGTVTDDPVPGLIGSTETLAWNLGVVSDGQTAGLCYAMAFDESCGEPPSSLIVQTGGEALWQTTSGTRVSESFGSQRLRNIQQCQIAIPVELTGFRATASGREITLVWRTASEVDNAGFGIERAAGDGDFQEIGFVSGNGTSLSPIAYRFVDTDLSPGNFRYRLRQVDFDGSFEYSAAVEARVELPASHFMSSVHPNPFRSRARFELSVARTQEVRINLLDVMGRPVMTVSNEPVTSGSTRSVQLDATGLPAGTYVLRVVGENFSSSRLVAVIR